MGIDNFHGTCPQCHAKVYMEHNPSLVKGSHLWTGKCESSHEVRLTTFTPHNTLRNKEVPMRTLEDIHTKRFSDNPSQLETYAKELSVESPITIWYDVVEKMHQWTDGDAVKLHMHLSTSQVCDLLGVDVSRELEELSSPLIQAIKIISGINDEHMYEVSLSAGQVQQRRDN